MTPVAPARRRDSARRIAPLAWPVFVGQVAVLAFGTVDTVLVARSSAADLAALAIGSAAYVTIFVGLMGVVMAIGPIVGQHYGAGRLRQAGEQVHQAVWLALGLSVLGAAALAFPAPFLAMADADVAVAAKVRSYLLALAVALPASLLFQVFRGFNTAVSQPKRVMALQVAGLAIKIPLSVVLVFGAALPGGLQVPALGVGGCGIATALAMWLQTAGAFVVMRRDRGNDRFALWGRGLHPPARAGLADQLRLGVPMGLSILIEVTGFSFMAIFIARLGTTPVAGHQIAVNLVSMMFMMPLAVANAASTLVAQQIGAGDLRDARRLGWHALQLGTLLAAVTGSLVYLGRETVIGAYTRNPDIAAAALPLIAWLVVFHIADAAQTIAAFVLRAYRIAVVPLAIYVAALWGIGLGGGNLLAFGGLGGGEAALSGARAFWATATFGLVLAGLALTAFLLWVLKHKARD